MLEEEGAGGADELGRASFLVLGLINQPQG